MTEKRAFRIGKLNTVGQVCGELSRLYRRASHGKIDTNDAAKLSGILQNLRGGLEQGIVEQRLSVIEQNLTRLAQHRAPILLEAKDNDE
jgi:hypothetical protein